VIINTKKDELIEKEKKSENIIAYSADSESQWGDNQYKKVINDVVYYFNNSDANGKVDQVKDNLEAAVPEVTIGGDPIDNIMTNEIVAKIREDRKVNQVIEVDLEENIPETNIKDNETPEINHVDEELVFSAVMEIDESATSKVHSDTFLHPVAFECTDSKTQPSIDSGNDCNGQVEDKKLFAIIDEIPQNPVTTENFDFATTGSYKQAEIDPMPSDPGTIEEKEQRPKSASHSRQTTASNKHKIEEELRESDEEKAAKREEDTAIDKDENLPPEKPISFNKMKNRASKDLNITPMRSDSRRPKSARVRAKKEVEKTRPTRPQSSRVQGVDRCKERARLTSKGLVRQKSREALEVQGRRSREDMELEGRRRKELLEVQGKNCRNIMELLTEEGEEGMDYMARGVLPSRPYTGTGRGFQVGDMLVAPHRAPSTTSTSSMGVQPRERAPPLPPIPSRTSLEEEEEVQVLVESWRRVEVEREEELALDEEAWSKWLRSSKPATPLPRCTTTTTTTTVALIDITTKSIITTIATSG